MSERWRLKTTSPDDLFYELSACHRGEKKFVLAHFTSADNKQRMIERLDFKEKWSSLDVLDLVPVWFFLVCRKDVPKHDRIKMAKSINKCAGHDAIWKGNQFGYSAKEISWYISQVIVAKKKLSKYQEEEY